MNRLIRTSQYLLRTITYTFTSKFLSNILVLDKNTAATLQKMLEIVAISVLNTWTKLRCMATVLFVVCFATYLKFLIIYIYIRAAQVLRDFSGAKFGRIGLATTLAILAIGSMSVLPYTRTQHASAAINDKINFQARILQANGAVVADGAYNVQFNLYSVSSGGSSLWTETYLNSNTQGIVTKNGYITTSLGSLTSFPNNIPWDQDLWIGMTIRGTGSCAWGSCTPADTEMTPRMKVTAVPYAFRAAEATQLKTVNGANVASLSINTTTSNQTFQIQDQGAAGTYNLCIQNSSGCGFALLSGANTFTGLNTFSSAGTALSVTNNASIGGVLTVGSGAGTGLFTNNGATLNTTLAIGDKDYTGSGNTGTIGTAAATVDIYTNFTIAQTTAGQTLTIPAPTTTTTGRIIYITNIGSAGYTIAGSVASPGTTMAYIWNSTTSAWTLVSSGTTGAYIQNGTTVQTANMNIQSIATGSVTATIQGANSQSANILEVKAAGVSNPLFSVGATGAITAQNSADSANALSVKNATGDKVFTVSTSSVNANLISNSSFENGVTGWSAKNGAGAPAQSSAQKLYDSNSMSFTTTAANQGAIFDVSLSPSTAYTFVAYVRSNVASANVFTLGRQDVAGTDVNCTGTGLNQAINNSGWNKVICNFTTGGTITPPSRIYMIQTDAVARTIYVDGVYLLTGTQTGTQYTEGALNIKGSITTPLAIRTIENTYEALSVTNAAGARVLNFETVNNSLSVYGSTISSSASLGFSAPSITTGSGISVGGTGTTTGNGLLFNTTANTATTAKAINITGAAAAITADYSGQYINVSPTRTLTAAATRTDSGQFLNLVRSNTVNNAGATYNVSGTLANLQSNCTQTLGTCNDSGILLNLSQQYANATGALINVAGAGTGNLAVLDATNASANGVSIDVQSSANTQYALRVTSNNGATNGLYVRADGNVGIGTSAPGYLLDVNGSFGLAGAASFNGNVTIGDATTDRLTVTSQILGQDALVFQGATDNANTTTFTFTEPTGTNIITFPDASGTVQLSPAGSGNALVQVPSSNTDGTNGANVISPTGNSIVGLKVNGTTGTATNALQVNTPTTADTTAQLFVSTGANGNKGLVIQGVAGQSGGDYAFQVQSSAGAYLASIDLYGQFRSKFGYVLADQSVTDGKIVKYQTAGTGGITTYDVVVLANDGGNSRVIRTTTARDTRVYGIAGADLASGNYGGVIISGNYQVTATTGAVAIGDQLVTSTVAGQVQTDNNATSGIIGIATTTKGAGASGLVGIAVGAVRGQTNPDFGAGNLTTTGSLSAVGVNSGSGLLQGTGGLTISGAAISLNDNSNFNTNINTGTSTGAVSIGNSAAGAIALQSGSTIGLTGTTTITGLTTGDALTVNNSTSTGNIFVAQDGGSAVFTVGDYGDATFKTTGNRTNAFRVQRTGGDNILAVDTSANTIKVGNSAAASGADTTLFVVDSATTANAPTGANGGLYYDTTLNKFRCYENSAWADCINGGSGSFIQNQNAAQQATSNFWISGSGRADTSLLTPVVDVATAGTLSVGTSTATAISLGKAGITTTNAGALTVSQLLTGSLGATVSGAAINLNASSNFATNINTGTSTGAVSIGNSAAGAIALQSGAAVNITAGAASTWSTGANALTVTSSNFNVSSAGVITVAGAQTRDITTAGAATSNAIAIGPGTSTAATGTGAALNLRGGDQSGTTTSTGGALSILAGNATGGAGTRTGGGVTIDAGTGATANGAVTIGNTNAASIALGRSGITTTVTGGLTQATGAVSLSGNAASSLTTSAGALTLTSAAAATWSTTAGNLTLQAGSGTVSLGTSTALTASGALGITSGGATAMSLDAGGAATLSVGTTNANAVSISRTGVTTTVNGVLTVAENTNLNGNTTIGNATTDRLTVTSQILGQDALVFQGATDDAFTTTLRLTDPTGSSKIITLPNETGTVCTTGSVCTGYAAAAASGSYIKQVPTTTADNTITPTANSVVGLTVTGTSGTAATALSVLQPGAAAGITIASANNTATDALSFSGTFTNLINATNLTVTNAGNADFAGTLTAGTGNAFTVSAAGAIVGVGVNSGTGLLQGTGGLTLTGTTSINATGAGTTTIGSAAAGNISLTSGGTIGLVGTTYLNNNSGASTNINTGTSTGAVSIGNSAAGAIALQSGAAVNITAGAASTWSTGANTLTVTSSNFNVSSAGVITVAGAQTRDITTASAATSNAIAIGPGTSTAATGTGAALNLRGGDQSGTTTSTGGALSILAGNATGAAGTRTGGGVTIDAGTGATANGAVTIGNTNAASIALGRSGITTTNAGALTVSQLLTGSLGATISGAAINLNASSNFATNINTGTSTGAVTIGGGTATSGTIALQGGAASSFSATNATGTTKLAFAAPSTAGTVTFQLPAGGTGATTYDICTTLNNCTTLTGYIQNQNAAAQATSNFWLSGTGRADTSFIAPLFSATTPTVAGNGGDVTLQGTNANTTGRGGNVSITAGNGVGTNQNGGNMTLTPGNKTGSGTAGSVIVKPNASNDSTSVFQVQNGAGSTVMNVNTTNRSVGINTNANTAYALDIRPVSGTDGIYVLQGSATDQLLTLRDSTDTRTMFNVNNNGWVLVQPRNDGVAFSIEDTTSADKFMVNTMYNTVGINYTLPNAADSALTVVNQNSAQSALTLTAHASQSGDILKVQNSANNVTYLGVSTTGISVTGNQTFAEGANRSVSVATRSTAGVGYNLSVTAGQANGANAGGILNLQGGAAAATAGSNGGAVAITGANGTATGTGGAGGNVTITAGNAAGTGTATTNGGTITLQAGSATGTGTAGGVLVKNAADSATAFQIQNAAGTSNLFVADTQNNKLGIGTNTLTNAFLTVTGTAPDIALGSALRVNSTMTSTTNNQYGTYSSAYVNPGAASTRMYVGSASYLYTDSANLSGVGATLNGLYGSVENGGTGTVNKASGLAVDIRSNSTGTITNAIGVEVYSPQGTGSITNSYGLVVRNQSKATNNYGLFIEGATTNPIKVQNGSGVDIFTMNQTGSTQIKTTTNATAAFQIQDTASASLFTANTVTRDGVTAGNTLKVGNSTGTDTATTVLIVDSATADPTTNLASLNGGLYYNSTTNKLSVVENSTVQQVCTTSGVCTGYAPSATNGYVQLAPAAVQTDTTNNNSIYINKANGTTGDLLRLQYNGGNAFRVASTGTTTIYKGLYLSGTTSGNVNLMVGSTVQNVGTDANQYSIQNQTDFDLTNMSVPLSNLYGHLNAQTITNGAGKTVINAYGLQARAIENGGSTMTSRYALHVDGNTANTGTITNNYGLYINDQSGVTVGTGNYPIYVDGSGTGALFSLNGTGSALFKTHTNSATGFQVQPSGSATPIFNVDTTNSRVGINTATQSYDLSFGQIAGATTARTIGVEAQGTAATGGNGLTVSAGTGNTSGVGGTLTLQGGTGGNAAAGGDVAINGGNAGGGSSAGGDIILTPGVATSGGAQGTVKISNGSLEMIGETTANALLSFNGNDIKSVSPTSQYIIQSQADFNLSTIVDQDGGANVVKVLNNLYGIINVPRITVAASGCTVATDCRVDNAAGEYVRVDNGGAYVTNMFGLRVDNGGTTNITNKFGVYVDQLSGGTRNFPIFVSAGSSSSSFFAVDNVGNTGIKLGTAVASADLSFGAGADRTINVTTQTTAATNGNGLTVTAGTGNTSGTGGILTLQGGTGGNIAVGGAVLLKGGTAGGGNTNGGNVTVTGGAPTGTGFQGVVNIASSAFISSTTQTFGVNGSITGAETYGTIPVSATASGLTITVPVPNVLHQVVGRLLYVTAVNGSNDFALMLGGTSVSISMKANSTATLVWNGTGWTAAGASSSTTLQASYDNTLISAGGAEILLNNSTAGGDGLTIRNNTGAKTLTGGLLEVQTSVGSNLFSVNNNASEYATNGGAETQGTLATNFPAASPTWITAPNGGTTATITRESSIIATGQGSVKVVTNGTTANQGVANQLANPSTGAAVALTPNLQYTVSFSVKGTANFALLDVVYSRDGTNTATTSCTTAQTVTETVWTRINCSFTAPATGITTSNAIFIRESDTTVRTFYIDNLSVTVNANTNHAVDGSVDAALGTNWVAIAGSVARDTTYIYDTNGSVAATTSGTAGRGVYNNLSNGIVPQSNNGQYRVSFYARGNTTNGLNIAVRYAPNAGSATGASDCKDYNTQAVAAAAFTLITCNFTTVGTTITSPSQLQITQTSGAATVFYVDGLTVNLNTNTSSNVQIGGANEGGPTTLFTLDRANTAPIAANNDAYLGSMYYDTTTGRIQCYEADGWGACGSAPDNIVNLNPEYSGAVLNGTGVGTMTTDFCSDQSGVLQVNQALCDGTGSPAVKATNYYKWTSPQATQQTYSIYVTYQLPTTFKGFSSDTTVNLTGRVDNTTNAAVTYQMFRSEGGTVSACGTETAVTTSANTWQTVGVNGNESTGCGFTSSSGGSYVIFKVNVKANSNANAYVGTLSFTTTGK